MVNKNLSDIAIW